MKHRFTNNMLIYNMNHVPYKSSYTIWQKPHGQASDGFDPCVHTVFHQLIHSKSILKARLSASSGDIDI